MEGKIMLIIQLFSGSLVLLGASLPLMNGKILPNYLLGFRTKKTLTNNEIWHKANKHAGKWWLVTGLAWLSGSLILLAVKDSLSVNIMCFAVISLVSVFFIGTISTIRYVKKL
jgi:uncharacterized membrane protein